MNELDCYKLYLLNTEGKKLSTSLDYPYRIQTLCKDENISLEDLTNNIVFYCRLYGSGGDKEAAGKKSHGAVISALKAYKRYLEYSG